MTWASLREEIEAEFAQLSWRSDEVDAELFGRHHWRRTQQREWNRTWYSKHRHDAAWLAARRERDRRWYERNREKVAKARASRPRPVLTAEQRMRQRASWRAYQRKRYRTDPVYRAKQLAHSKAQYAVRKERMR